MEFPDDYLEALRYVLGIEGGPTNHSWDPGGNTAFGIAKTYWPQYWADGPPTLEDAKEFYLVEFWRPLRLSALRDQVLRIEIFEAAVNCGLRDGARFAQSAYNLLKPEGWQQLVVDGVIGSKSIRALNRYTGHSREYLDSLLAGCNFYQAQHYVNVRPDLRAKAIRGWFAKRLCWSSSVEITFDPKPPGHPNCRCVVEEAKG